MSQEVKYCPKGHKFDHKLCPVCPVCWKEYYSNQGSSDLPKTSAPAERALQRAGIKTLEDLSFKTENEILALHGMGPKVVKVLKEALEERGLGFADNSNKVLT